MRKIEYKPAYWRKRGRLYAKYRIEFARRSSFAGKADARGGVWALAGFVPADLGDGKSLEWRSEAPIMPRTIPAKTAKITPRHQR
ncbi:hypothetical protein [Cohnella sp. REN36]|uniref:hypothetical protein n=1 Tax=Cohnella sp. REN36 TaxID=2887347 RepID=UPI001D1470CE|nr:hypothetical protein [Cohnella sp. REN36]MCC3371585.1 hypothetical protein [Cohnella sp. REN36]